MTEDSDDGKAAESVQCRAQYKNTTIWTGVATEPQEAGTEYAGNVWMVRERCGGWISKSKMADQWASHTASKTSEPFLSGTEPRKTPASYMLPSRPQLDGGWRPHAPVFSCRSVQADPNAISQQPQLSPRLAHSRLGPPSFGIRPIS